MLLQRTYHHCSCCSVPPLQLLQLPACSLQEGRYTAWTHEFHHHTRRQVVPRGRGLPVCQTPQRLVILWLRELRLMRLPFASHIALASAVNPARYGYLVGQTSRFSPASLAFLLFWSMAVSSWD